MLSEKSQRKRSTVWYHLCVESRKACKNRVKWWLLEEGVLFKGTDLQGGAQGNSEILRVQFQIAAEKWMCKKDARSVWFLIAYKGMFTLSCSLLNVQ